MRHIVRRFPSRNRNSGPFTFESEEGESWQALQEDRKMAQVKCGDIQAKARSGGLRSQRGTQMEDRAVTEETAGSIDLVEAELVGRGD